MTGENEVKNTGPANLLTGKEGVGDGDDDDDDNYHDGDDDDDYDYQVWKACSLTDRQGACCAQDREC